MNDANQEHPVVALEARQDEVLRDLDRLNDQIEQVLRSLGPTDADSRVTSFGPDAPACEWPGLLAER